MMIQYLHPILAALTIVLAFYVALLGWQLRLQPTAVGARAIHARKGVLLLILLGIIWLMGLSRI